MENKRAGKINYLVIALLFGLLCGTVPIIITEIIWDSVADLLWERSLTREIIESFFRAALLEEAFKFLGFWLADKKYRFTTEREYMLAAGTVGLVYLIVEKIVTMNPFSIILGIVFPMHILWQLNQGRHFYAYRNAKSQGDKKRAFRELFLSTAAIFLIHGCWDALLDISKFFIDKTDLPGAELAGGIIFAVIIVFGIVYAVISIKKAVRVIRNSRS